MNHIGAGTTMINTRTKSKHGYLKRNYAKHGFALKTLWEKRKLVVGALRPRRRRHSAAAQEEAIPTTRNDATGNTTLS